MRVISGNWAAIKEIFRVLILHRELMIELARRDISDRYAGQAMGLFWAIAHPIFLMALYVFVFAFVFKAKVGGTLEMPLDYTTYILCGLIPWLTIQEVMNKGCVAITSNSSLVKQVVFPLEVLPAKGVLSSLLPQLVSTFILVIYVLVMGKGLPLTYLLLPILLVMQVIAMIGIAYLLSAIGTYFRDLKEFVQVFGIAGMYAMPVVYLPGWVPAVFRPLLYANPFSYVIWCYQDALYFGRIEHPWAWVANLAFTIFVFTFGYRLFRKLKPGFGNTL